MQLTGPLQQLKGVLSIQTWRTLLILYGSQFAIALVSLIYGKITTVYIEPTQLGQYNVQLTGLLLVSACCINPLIQSFKFALQKQSVNWSVQFHLGLLWRVYLCIGVALVILIGTRTLPSYIGLLWIGLVGQSLLAFSNDYLNISFQYKSIAFLQVLNPVLNVAILTLVLFIWTETQTAGLWLNYGLLYCLLTFTAIWQIFRSRLSDGLTIRWDLPTDWRSKWPAMQAYIMPLVIYGFFGWSTAYLDRYLINRLLTTTDVGYYAIGYSLGARVAIISSPLLAHLTPIVMRAYQQPLPNKLAHVTIRKYLFIFWGISLPACLGLWVFNRPIGLLFMSEKYEPAFLVVPLVAFAYVFMLSNQFFETKFYATGRTKYILWHSLAGSLLNLCLNMYLIPKFGINGAGLAMICSSCCQFLIISILFHKVL